MHLHIHDAKITMTGLEEANALANEIHKKSSELLNLILGFDRLCFELGIEIIQAPNKAETTATDQT